MKPAIVLALAVGALAGCSSRSAFESMQANARLQCQKSADAEAARKCEAEVNNRNYDAYERDRPK